MSYCEGYIDPFDLDLHDDNIENDHEDEDHWTCAYPGKCLMPYHHCRDECHTVEDMEAYYKEVEGL